MLGSPTPTRPTPPLPVTSHLRYNAAYAVATGKKMKEAVPAPKKRAKKAAAKKAAKPDNDEDGQQPASESDAFSGDGENDIDDNTWDPLA